MGRSRASQPRHQRRSAVRHPYVHHRRTPITALLTGVALGARARYARLRAVLALAALLLTGAAPAAGAARPEAEPTDLRAVGHLELTPTPAAAPAVSSPPASTVSGTPFRSPEARRVEAHILRAERMLAEADVEHLGADRRARRAWAYATLQAYRAAGRYPENRSDRLETPVFVDDRGTHCALGALVEASGHEALVQRIRRDHNLLRVAELVGVEPELLAWLHAHGLSVEEAARIQPGYCYARAEILCSRFSELEGLAAVRFDVLSETDADLVVLEVRGAVGAIEPGARTRVSRPRYAGVVDGETWVLAVADGSLGAILGAYDAWGFRLFGDPACAAAPHLTLDVLLELEPGPGCVDALERADPRWAGSLCDGGSSIDCEAPVEGYPREPWPEPETAPPSGDPAPTPLSMPEEAVGCRSTRGHGPFGLTLVALLLVPIARRARRRAP